MAKFKFLKEFEQDKPKQTDPKPKKQKASSVREWWANLNLSDYSDKASFNEAFRTARNNSEKEFIWNKERYSTKLVSKKTESNYTQSKNWLNDYLKKTPLSITRQDSLDAKRDPTIMSKTVKDDRTKLVNNLNKPIYFSITEQKGNVHEDGYYQKEKITNIKTGKKTVKEKFFVTDKGKTTPVHELAHKAGLKTNQDDILHLYDIQDKRKRDIFTDELPAHGFEYVADPSERAARHISVKKFIKDKLNSDTIGEKEFNYIDSLNNSFVNHFHKDYAKSYDMVKSKVKTREAVDLPYDIKQLYELYGGDKKEFIKQLNTPLGLNKEDSDDKTDNKMAKYKYLRGGRVFESDKKYNLPQIGADGKLVSPTKKIPTAKPDPIGEEIVTRTANAIRSYPNPKMKEWEAKNTPWLNPERRWNGGDTALGKGDDLYINDAGNLSKKPLAKPVNPLLQLPLVKQDNTRPKFASGGITGIVGNASYGVSQGNYSGPKKKNNIDFGKSLGNAAPFLDNIGNLIATSKTPNIPEPVLTSAPRLATKFNIQPQVRRVENDVRSLSQGIDASTSSAGVANANKGKLLADKFRAVGDLEANKQNFETQMGNQASMADFQARRENNQLINKRNEMQMMRKDDINTRYADVVGNFGDDIANINREKNMMARDKDAMRMLMKTNPDAVYQFADTDTFKGLYKNDEPALRKLILNQKGSAQKAKLTALYKQLYNTDFTE